MMNENQIINEMVEFITRIEKENNESLYYSNDSNTKSKTVIINKIIEHLEQINYDEN